MLVRVALVVADEELLMNPALKLGSVGPEHDLSGVAHFLILTGPLVDPLALCTNLGLLAAACTPIPAAF